MATYIIGYDLHPSRGETYGELIKAIESISGIHWRLLDSTWIVVSDKSAVQIRDDLLPHIKNDDQLLVVLSGREAAWYGYTEDGTNWLKAHL